MAEAQSHDKAEILLADGLYGDYSYSFVSFYETRTTNLTGVPLPEKCIETHIFFRNSDFTESHQEFLTRTLSISMLPSHPNFLKVFSVQQNFLQSSKNDRLLSRFYSEFAYRVGSIRPRILPPTLDRLICFQIQTEVHGQTLETLFKTTTPKINADSTRSLQIQIIHGILEAMKFLHRQGIQHNHLDRRNVVFSGNKFELPVKIGFLSENLHTQGDIHSLGELFYEILEYTWHRESIAESMFIWLVGRRPLQNQMILNGESILRKMVEEDDAKKFQSLEEIRIELDPDVIPDKASSSQMDAISQVLHQLSHPDGTEWSNNVTFLKPLGNGAFGHVTQTRNKQTGDVTAVKILVCQDNDYDDNSTSEVKMGEKEYNNIKFTFHRNLVRTHQIREKFMSIEQLRRISHKISKDPEFESMLSCLCFQQDKTKKSIIIKEDVKLLCLEMELCGPDLTYWLQYGKERDSGTIQLLIIHDILEGLSFLHANNIIHRDLKPDNILFSPGEKFPVKIGDFGLSRILQQNTQFDVETENCEIIHENLTTNIGTPIYRAPEVSIGLYGKQVDLYSLGFIIWEILCKIPIPPKERRQHFKSLKNQEYSIIREEEANCFISNGKEIIISLTQPQPEDRLQSVQDIHLVTVPTEFLPRDTLELKTFLKCGGPGSKIIMGQVSCHKTNLFSRNDTMIIEWNENTKDQQNPDNDGFNTKDGVIIKGTEPDELFGFDIKLIGVKLQNEVELEKETYFRILYINFQEVVNCPDACKGWKYPASIRLSEEKLQFSGVTDFNFNAADSVMNNPRNAFNQEEQIDEIEEEKVLIKEEIIRNIDRKVVITVEVDRCVLALKKDDDRVWSTLKDVVKMPLANYERIEGIGIVYL